MGVPIGDRKESRVEFDNTYFKVYEDAVKLTLLNFGGKDELKETYSQYIQVMSQEVLETVSQMGRYIRIANAIFPTNRLELEERRLAQDKAIGLCFDLLTKYQLIMKLLKVSDNKYVGEINNIRHEINCLKRWRTSDNKRFKG